MAKRRGHALVTLATALSLAFVFIPGLSRPWQVVVAVVGLIVVGFLGWLAQRRFSSGAGHD